MNSNKKGKSWELEVAHALEATFEGKFSRVPRSGGMFGGKNIVDATVDPMVGIELLYPEAAKRFGGKGLQNAFFHQGYILNILEFSTRLM